jgi:adenosine deaminase
MAVLSPTSWYHKVPKIELHLHLEGAIPTEALWHLIQKYGGDPGVPDYDSLVKRFEYRDFLHFLETWMWKNSFLREYDDFAFISEAVAKDLASQNIRYVEAFFSPADFASHGLETQKLVEAIRAGLDRIKEIQINLVADLVRTTPRDKANQILMELNEVKKLGIVGIGIGGPEDGFPPEPFSEIYELARQMGFHTNAHAGESAGADSIWGAIDSLHVERIGHGTRAFEDERLLDYLVEYQIPLEMCPISNVRTAVVDSIESHPVRAYYERGIIVTINSDDPKMFDNSLAEEYYLLENILGFSRTEILTLIDNAIGASWLAEDQKRDLAAQIHQDPGWLNMAI